LKKRAEREKLSEAEVKAIIELVNNGNLNPMEPRFTYEEKTAVLLMEAPTSKGLEVREMKSGAVSVSLLFQGEWVSIIMNNKSFADMIEPEDHYVVAGDYWETEDKESGKVYLNMRAKAIMPLADLIAIKNNKGKDYDVTKFTG